jgi:GntR family transcriptional repressor for pyruvate dehydrogenase complex
VVESECAARGARNATAAQIRQMKAALASMNRDRRKHIVPLDGDHLFHLSIAESSGNSALALLVRTLWAQRTGPLFLQLEHHFDTPELWSAAIDEHQSVLDAIEARKPAAARAAMRRHLLRAGRRFKRGFGK